MDALTRDRHGTRTSPVDAAWHPALPPEAPLEMPTQSLWRWRKAERRPATSPSGVWFRRLLVIGSTVAMTMAAASEMHSVLNVGGLTFLESIVLVLFVALFAWIAFSFVSSTCGFISLLFGGGRSLGIDPDGDQPPLATRTALLMPTYNEEPSRVMAELQAIHESLDALGVIGHFDIFILSDTTDANIWVAEEAAFLALRERTGGHGRIFYRRRRKNTERKAGNVADWVKRFGGSYPQMLVLDADSVMSGDTIVRMAAAMEQNPGVGLIQTMPVIVNGTSLFARMQQFAGRVYGPVIAHGIAWWHGADSNYWGHNAIIRTQAFAEQAGLPHLPGPKPFGGHIMSHDFIEAALMRRGGWAIHMVPALSGSYEESPPSLPDFSIRDRRWCQGNLQHIMVLPARGLHPISRLHMLVGIGSYITAPMWLFFLIAGVLISLQARFIPPAYFTAEFSLFPQWPAQDPVRAIWVFAGTMAILLAPKVMGYVAMLTDRATRRGCGGAIRAFLSLILETLIAGLIAPVAMLIQSVGIGGILLGRDAGWNPQRRGDGTIPFGDMVRRYWPHTFFGLAFGTAAFAVSPWLLMWMSPFVLGLTLAIPLASFTASGRAGHIFRKLGLMRIPEETTPPPVLTRANELFARLEAEERPASVTALLRDPGLLAAHKRMLPRPRQRKNDPIDPDFVLGMAKLEDADTLDEALHALSRSELAAVTGDERGLDRLLALDATASS